MGLEFFVGAVVMFAVVAWCHAFCIDGKNILPGTPADLHHKVVGATLNEWRGKVSKWVLHTAGLYGGARETGASGGMRKALAASSSMFESRGEKLTRDILENDVFPGRIFASVRPNWLKNPETGRNLELDCYNESLRLAVEVHGKQHYEQVDIMHGSGKAGLEAFRKGQQRDSLKRSLCAKRGVRLIEVPYSHTRSREGCLSFLRGELGM